MDVMLSAPLENAMHPSAIISDPPDHDHDGHGADVIRIRLWNGRSGCALVSEFYSADRVLAGWSERLGAGAVTFEVVFDDGLVVQGAHDFFRKGRRTCLFATHVQRILRRRHGPPVHLAAPMPAPALAGHGPARCFMRT